MRNTNRIISFLAVTLLVAGTWGCEQKQPVSMAPAPSAPQQAATPAPAPAAAPVAAPASSPAAAPANAPLASTDGDIPGLRISVDGLKRTSDTLTLKFTVYNSSGTDNNLMHTLANTDDGRYADLRAVYLVDAQGKKKYFVVTDSEGAYVSSNQLGWVGKGSQASLWAKFPAPPDDVTKMTVAIPHFIPVEDVPIGR